MLGEWKTRCGLFAVVDSEEEGRLLGTLFIPTWSEFGKESILPMIPTYWDLKGNNRNRAFDLITRKRGAELWSKTSSSSQE